MMSAGFGAQLKKQLTSIIHISQRFKAMASVLPLPTVMQTVYNSGDFQTTGCIEGMSDARQ